MSTSAQAPDPGENAAPAETEEVTARIPSEHVARLDHAADRRGIGREEMLAEAIDAFLAREMWSGGLIAPPPPMEIPASGAKASLRRWRRG